MDAFEAIAVLDEPVRRRLYDFVRRARRPVTREESAKAQRISVKLAAFHLEKLVDAGLLQVRPGVDEGTPRRVGRTPKRYELSDTEVSVSLPARRYDLLAEILLDVLVDANAGGSELAPMATAVRVAHDRGHGYAGRANLGHGRAGAERTIAAADELLEGLGYEPADDGEGGLMLANCPFHALMRRAPAVVCAINASFVDGVLRGLGNESVRAALEPGDDRCCVRIRPPTGTAD